MNEFLIIWNSVMLGILFSYLMLYLYWELPSWIHCFIHRNDPSYRPIMPSYHESIVDMYYKHSIINLEEERK